MVRKRKKLWALLLSAALVLTQLPAVVLAETYDAADERTGEASEDISEALGDTSEALGRDMSGNNAGGGLSGNTVGDEDEPKSEPEPEQEPEASGPMHIAPRMMADNYEIDGIIYKEIGAGEAVVAGPVDKTAASLTVRAGIDVTDRLSGEQKTLTVVRIGDRAFFGCQQLTTIVLPDTLRAIGEMAFQDCSGLTLDRLPASLRFVGSRAFRGCGKLTLTGLPSGLQSIGWGAFEGCKSLTVSKLPDGIKALEKAVFSGCSGLALTALPDSVEFIGESAFYDCGNLELNALPDTLKIIGNFAFSGCRKLQAISIPMGVTAIGEDAFSDMGPGFRAVVTSDHVRTLLLQSGLPASQIDYSGGAATGRLLADYNGDGADYLVYTEGGRNQAVLIKGPNRAGFTVPGTVMDGGTSYTVTRIGDSAFFFCTKLTLAAPLPDTIEAVGFAAFSYCASLELDGLPAGLTEIAANAFANCPRLALQKLPDGLRVIGESAFAFDESLALTALPDSVAAIGMSAFWDCKSLALTALPDGLTTIGNSAFYGCERLALTELPDALQVIGYDAFAGCTGLRALHIGPNVTAIGAGAFSPLDSKGVTLYDRLLPHLMLTAESPEVQRLLAALPGMDADNLPRLAWDGSADAKAPGVYELTGDVTVRGRRVIEAGASLLGSGTITVPHDAGLYVLGYVAPGIDIIFETAQTVKEAKVSGGGSRTPSQIPSTPQSSYTLEGNSFLISIPRGDLQWLQDNGRTLSIENAAMKTAFTPAALRVILSATAEAIDDRATFAAAPANLSGYPVAAALIGARPAYEITISYRDDRGEAVTVRTDFPAGAASVSLYYERGLLESEGSLFMVCAEGDGAVTWLDKSAYRTDYEEGAKEKAPEHGRGRVLAEAPHFSVYGVAYKAPAPVFTDTGSHWAKEEIAFAAARGLIPAAAETAEGSRFSPDAPMTREMFAAALGRLAGVDPKAYRSRSFRDVAADAFCAPYVEWAVQKNIISAADGKLFHPEEPVTREQMAVIMANYAVQMGYSLKTPVRAYVFADNAEISTPAFHEVAAMQWAGIIRAKDGNRFEPQAAATRAEVSAVLRRFVEVTVDPGTALGWGRNDSGRWLYY